MRWGFQMPPRSSLPSNHQPLITPLKFNTEIQIQDFEKGASFSKGSFSGSMLKFSGSMLNLKKKTASNVTFSTITSVVA